MAKETILVVEDEEDIQELVRYNLAKEGHRVMLAGTGEDGLRAARAELPGLILLDLMLPGVDGLEVCRILKADSKTRHIPVIMLTAKGENDVVAGLELGADDYITKPFSPKCSWPGCGPSFAVAREPCRGRQQPGQIHDRSFTPGRHEVLHRGKAIELTATEFKLLQFLARRPGWVFTRQQIVDGVKGEDYPVTDRAVDVQIVGLRKKLGGAGEYIETVRGVGYRFKE